MTRPVTAAGSRSRMISSCWAASRARACVRKSVSSSIVCPDLDEPLLEPGVLGLESGDLSYARVRDLAGLLQGLETPFELDAEVSVGAGAVEVGAVAVGFAGAGLDVAFATGRDLAAQGAIDGGPDAVLVLGSLGCGDSHADASSVVVLAASISVTTRRARS